MRHYFLRTMAGTGRDYWIGILGSGAEYGYGIAVDSAGFIYVAGSTSSQGSGGQDALLVKYNSSGNIVWQIAYGKTSSDSGVDVAVGSNDDVYLLAAGGAEGSFTGGALIAKYNSSAEIQWQRSLSDNYGIGPYGIALDSSDNVYVAGFLSETPWKAFAAKYSSTGSFQWGSRYYQISVNYRLSGIATDSSGFVYLSGGHITSYGSLIKLSGAAAIQWQKQYASGQSVYLAKVQTDASGNVYCVYTNQTGSPAKMLLVKYNTSGSLLWQRFISGANADGARPIAINSSGDIFVVGHTSLEGSGLSDIFIVKYNSSGTLQWQRTLGSTADDTAKGVAVDSAGSIYIVGTTNIDGGSPNLFVSKLPDDGSGTGSYGDFNYSVATLTESAGAGTDSVHSVTTGSGPAYAQTRTLNTTIISLPSTVIGI